MGSNEGAAVYYYTQNLSKTHFKSEEAVKGAWH